MTNRASFTQGHSRKWVAGGSDKELAMVIERAWREGRHAAQTVGPSFQHFQSVSPVFGLYLNPQPEMSPHLIFQSRFSPKSRVLVDA